VSSGFLAEVLSFKLCWHLLRRFGGGSVMVDSYGRFSIHAKQARQFHSWGQKYDLVKSWIN
jgi:hypothetical protein